MSAKDREYRFDTWPCWHVFLFGDLSSMLTGDLFHKRFGTAGITRMRKPSHGVTECLGFG